MYVKRNEIKGKLIELGYNQGETQAIIDYITGFGIFENDEILIVIDTLVGGYYIEQKTA